MPTKQEVIDGIKWSTTRISDRVWTISVGVVAMSLGYIVESAAQGSEPFLEPRQVAVPAGLALLAMCADLVQYSAATRQDLELLRRMEAEGLSEARYKVSSASRRVRTIAYRSKFTLCIASAVILALLSTRRALELY
jgi:hypothetical protein